MKKNFNTPEMNITLFAVENIVTQSAVKKAQQAVEAQAAQAAAAQTDAGVQISDLTLVF